MLATVPVGLPVSVRLGMIFVAKCLGRHQVLTKTPGNMLTLGAVSVALMDKTGVLTQNKAEVYRVLTAMDIVETDQSTNEAFIGGRNDALQATYHIAALCNESHTQDPRPVDDTQIELGRVNESEVIGSTSVDRGLLMWAREHINVDELRAGREVKTIIPFSGECFLSVSSVTLSKQPDKMVLMAKGAPEAVLPLCSHYMCAGHLKVLSDAFKGKLLKLINLEAERGSRIVIMTQSSESRNTIVENPNKETDPLSDLVFVSAVAISDPPRDGAREMVAEIRSAGILVSMMTGDLVATATAVANSEKVFTGGRYPVHTLNTLHGSLISNTYGHLSIVVTGDDVDQMSDVEWDYVFQHPEVVFARTSR
eukprot:gene45073-56108_t